MDIQFIVGVITIIASMYGMLKFMLKDTHKEVEILEKSFEKSREDHKESMKEFKYEMHEFKNEMKFMHNRLDGLYRVLLERTYGKNIPEELK